MVNLWYNFFVWMFSVIVTLLMNIFACVSGLFWEAHCSMTVGMQKPQLMGLVRQLSRRDSMNSPGNRDDRGWTPLHVAARRGDLNEVCGHCPVLLHSVYDICTSCSSSSLQMHFKNANVSATSTDFGSFLLPSMVVQWGH